MEYDSISDKEKIKIRTLEDVSDSSYSRFKYSSQFPTKIKYKLMTTKIQVQHPTTNGFRYSELNYEPLLPEPEILLQSFNIAKDEEHEFILKAKFAYQKIGSYLQQRGHSINSSKIIEAILFDNEIETELTFDIEVVMNNYLTFNDLINLEDEIADVLENDLIEYFKSNLIELNVSLYSLEDL